VQAAHRVVYSPGYGRLISAGRDGLTLVWDPRSVGRHCSQAEPKRAHKHQSVSRARVTQRSVVVRRGFAASPQRRGLGAQSLGAAGGTAGGGMNGALCDASDRDFALATQARRPRQADRAGG
jgi:hypothetical protein